MKIINRFKIYWKNSSTITKNGIIALIILLFAIMIGIIACLFLAPIILGGLLLTCLSIYVMASLFLWMLE